MAYLVKFSASFVRSLGKAVDYYEGISVSKSADFLEDVEDTLQLINQNPKESQILYGKVRRKLLKRFPYSIFYALYENEQQILFYATFCIREVIQTIGQILSMNEKLTIFSTNETTIPTSYPLCTDRLYTSSLYAFSRSSYGRNKGC